MARTISTALQAELDKTVTRVGYLLEISFSPITRWCNVGQVTWNSQTWSSVEFEVQGIGSDGSGASRASFRVQNLDSAAAALFLDADMSSLTADVWQIAPGATGASDVVRLGKFMFDGMEIGPQSLTATLIPQNSIDAFSPRVRIDPANGFRFALAPETVIAWGNELYVVGDNRG